MKKFAYEFFGAALLWIVGAAMTTIAPQTRSRWARTIGIVIELSAMLLMTLAIAYSWPL